MADVIWTAKAIRNIEAIRTYIAQFSPLASQRMALRLMLGGDSLAEHPERGAPIPGGRRQLTHISPYLLRYKVVGGRVFILDVRHAAENAP